MTGELWVLEPFDTSGWHKRLRELYDYWQQLPRIGGPLPGRPSFDPLAVPKVLPSIWLLDVEREPFRLRYRLVGTNAVRAMSDDPTGRYLDEVRPTTWKTPPVHDRLHQATFKGVATYAIMAPRMDLEAVWVKIESLILPFASDGTTVDILMGCSMFHRADGQVL
jgi:hypothetical protein